MNKLYLPDSILEQAIENRFEDIDIDMLFQNIEMEEIFDLINLTEYDEFQNDKFIRIIEEYIIRKEKSTLDKAVQRYKEEYIECIKKYIEQLTLIQNIIAKQIKMLNNFMQDEKELEINECISNQKLITKKILHLSDISLSSKNAEEQEIYKSIQVYNFLKEFFDEDWKYNSQNEINWKTYFYLGMDLEKQKRHNVACLNYYKKKNKESVEKNFNEEINKYFVIDFQGKLSEVISNQRKKMKLTQKQLQEKSGVDRSMIAKIEKVQQPATLETAIRLLTSLNVGIALYPLCEQETKI